MTSMMEMMMGGGSWGAGQGGGQGGSQGGKGKGPNLMWCDMSYVVMCHVLRHATV